MSEGLRWTWDAWVSLYGAILHAHGDQVLTHELTNGRRKATRRWYRRLCRASVKLDNNLL